MKNFEFRFSNVESRGRATLSSLSARRYTGQPRITSVVGRSPVYGTAPNHFGGWALACLQDSPESLRWLSVQRLRCQPLLSTFDVRRSAFGARRLLLVLLVIVISSSASAQTITLQTGQKIETQGLRRDGDMVMGKVQIGTGSGEVGYHLAQITKVDFPEPRALKAASDFLVQGQPDKALAELNPVITYYAPFKDVPGNWWAQAALIKVSILAAQKHEDQAEALATEIEKSVKDPDMARAAQLRLVGALIRTTEYEKAISICDGAIKSSIDPTTLATAWVAKGDALLAQKEPAEALMAYLHVPVFYPDEKLFQAAAMLGAGKAYRRLNDVGRAKKSLNDLIAQFPESAEATLAQNELKKL